MLFKPKYAYIFKLLNYSNCYELIKQHNDIFLNRLRHRPSKSTEITDKEIFNALHSIQYADVFSVMERLYCIYCVNSFVTQEIIYSLSNRVYVFPWSTTHIYC